MNPFIHSQNKQSLALFFSRFPWLGSAIWGMLLLMVLGFQFLYSLHSDSTFDYRSVQSQLWHQQAILSENATSVSDQINLHADDLWVMMDSYNSKDELLIVFRDTTVVGWSSQMLSVDGYRFTDFNKPLIHLPNGWFLVSQAGGEQFGVVALFRIKSDYPYQNQYLVNDFHPSLGLNSNFDVSDTFVPGAMHLVDQKGNFLLSLINQQSVDDAYKYGVASFIFLILWLFVSAALLYSILKKLKSARRVIYFWWASVLVLTALYYILFVSGWYSAISRLEIFSPVWFAYSTWLASLGAFFMAIVFMTYLIWLFCIFYNRPFSLIKNGLLLTICSWILLISYFLLVNYLFYILVEHSADSFLLMHISDFNVVSLVKVIILFLVIFSFVLLVNRMLSVIIPRNSLILFWGTLIAIAGIILLIAKFYPILAGWDGALFFIAVVVFLWWLRQKARLFFSFRNIVWLLIIADVYAVGRIHVLNIAKEQANRLFLIEMLANNMTGEQDPVAEMYLTNMENKIASDHKLIKLIADGNIYDEQLQQYLMKTYFVGYLNRYDIQIVPCWPKAELYVDGTEKSYDCYLYFDEMLLRYGEAVTGSHHFHSMKKDNGQVNYFGVFDYFKGQAGLELSIFLEFTSKPYFEGLGYPELLLSDKDRNRLNLMEGYSYAGYVDDKLVKRSGDYLYEVSSKQLSLLKNEKRWVKADGFTHLYYAYRSGALVVMSFPLIGISNVLIAFSLIFVIFLTLASLMLIGEKFFSSKPSTSFSIQQRIQISMTVFMVFLLLVIGFITLIYAAWQFKNRNSEMLSQRLKSVVLEMEQKVGEEDALSPEMAEYLSYLLQNFSNVFYTDINLYALDGELLATSRPELYQKGIIGKLMDPAAFNALSSTGSREFIHEESIGNLKFTSAYVPFMNQDNEVLAYLNLPYFVSSNELRDEISSIIVAIVNAYLIFVMLAIGLAVFASRQITRPLLLIRQRLNQTRLGLQNEKITYSGADEIGNLVEAYNRMVDELALSADKLARSERELAWREMAKQVAHEIKNPLTPMQLSVQYLQKAWKDQVPDFDNYIRRVTQTLIEQIQQLSVIANEFSHFAKMPVAKRQEMTVMDKLYNTVSLYEKSSQVVFTVNCLCSPDLKVFMDGEQLLSVFNNLIKNAVQAIPDEREGRIDINVNQHDNMIVIAFTDNGKGIPDDIKDKMFVPNFTTKTSGMGLGLAIVKNIIESSEGSISYISQADKGTTFYVRLPLSGEVK